MTYEQLVKGYKSHHEAFYRDPSLAYMEPFHIYGPIYYVGDKQVCVHLIDTGDGLLMIDAGFPQTIHMLTDSIFRLGFDPRDIRCILHTHGHFDHFGASNEFRRLYGCSLAIGRLDAELLRRVPAASLTEWCDTVAPMMYVPEFQIELDDDDTFTMGDVSIRCMNIPGHTPGAMAFFFDVTENGITYRAGLFGGAGLGSVRRTSLRLFDEPLSLQQDMIRSIERARTEHVEIMLGNHPGNNDVAGRRARQLAQGGNPFIDACAWGEFLDRTLKKVLELLAEEKRETDAEHAAL